MLFSSDNSQTISHQIIHINIFRFIILSSTEFLNALKEHGWKKFPIHSNFVPAWCWKLNPFPYSSKVKMHKTDWIFCIHQRADLNVRISECSWSYQMDPTFYFDTSLQFPKHPQRSILQNLQRYPKQTDSYELQSHAKHFLRSLSLHK